MNSALIQILHLLPSHKYHIFCPHTDTISSAPIQTLYLKTSYRYIFCPHTVIQILYILPSYRYIFCHHMDTTSSVIVCFHIVCPYLDIVPSVLTPKSYYVLPLILSLQRYYTSCLPTSSSVLTLTSFTCALRRSIVLHFFLTC